jgi:hypothetical protein
VQNQSNLTTGFPSLWPQNQSQIEWNRGNASQGRLSQNESNDENNRNSQPLNVRPYVPRQKSGNNQPSTSSYLINPDEPKPIVEFLKQDIETQEQKLQEEEQKPKKKPSEKKEFMKKLLSMDNDILKGDDLEIYHRYNPTKKPDGTTVRGGQIKASTAHANILKRQKAKAEAKAKKDED